MKSDDCKDERWRKRKRFLTLSEGSTSCIKMDVGGGLRSSEKGIEEQASLTKCSFSGNTYYSSMYSTGIHWNPSDSRNSGGFRPESAFKL